jgi:diaminopimelate decarboxylase
MSHFSHQDGVLHAESVPLSRHRPAVRHPTYVYSKAQLLQNFRGYADAQPGP